MTSLNRYEAMIRSLRFLEELAVLNPEDRMVKLASLWPKLNDEQRRKLLIFAWQENDEAEETGDVALALFREVGFVTDAPEANLSRELTIYRGSPDRFRPLRSGELAWTLDEGVAHWFANCHTTTPGVVLRAKASASDVLGYLTRLHEDEIIIEPTSLRGTEEIPVCRPDTPRPGFTCLRVHPHYRSPEWSTLRTIT